MRVAFILHTNGIRGGASVVFLNTIPRLRTFGIDPVVLLKESGEGQKRDLITAFEEQGITPKKLTFNHWCKDPQVVRRQPWRKLASAAINWRCDKQLLSLFKRNRPDAVVVFDGVIGVGYIPAQKLRIPCIGYFQEVTDEGLGLQFYRESEVRRKLDTTACCIAISEYVKERWSRYVDGQRIRVIPNGLDFSHVWWQARTYCPNGIARITIAGSVTPTKGQYDLVRAVAKVLENGRTRLLLTVYGAKPENDDPYERAIRSFVADNHLEQSVKLYPYSHQMDQVWGQTDIAVSCSHAEGFGLSLLEAMASGCMVVGPNSGAVPELLADCRGVTYAEGDVDSLANALKRAIQCVKHPDEQQIEASKDYAQGFTVEAQVAKIADVLMSVAGMAEE